MDEPLLQRRLTLASSAVALISGIFSFLLQDQLAWMRQDIAHEVAVFLAIAFSLGIVLLLVATVRIRSALTAAVLLLFVGASALAAVTYASLAVNSSWSAESAYRVSGEERPTAPYR